MRIEIAGGKIASNAVVEFINSITAWGHGCAAPARAHAHITDNKFVGKYLFNRFGDLSKITLRLSRRLRRVESTRVVVVRASWFAHSAGCLVTSRDREGISRSLLVSGRISGKIPCGKESLPSQRSAASPHPSADQDLGKFPPGRPRCGDVHPFPGDDLQADMVGPSREVLVDALLDNVCWSAGE